MIELTPEEIRFVVVALQLMPTPRTSRTVARLLQCLRGDDVSPGQLDLWSRQLWRNDVYRLLMPYEVIP